MNAPVVFAEGRQVRLGARIGKGGEGEVYAVEGSTDQALKIYTVSDVVSREAKIAAMVRAELARNSDLVSYPSALVTDARGRFAGFLMRLVRGHQPIHHLYSTLDRKTYFPSTDYRFLVRAALNVSRALADVHSRNCVVGDINHSGFLISDQAIVALIDADSFQIVDGLTRHLCKVGVPEYTPPELQGQSLDGVLRTTNHDAFGLAVILFQLLWLGRLPFVGSYSQGEMPMERAIAEYRFAYSLRRSVGMTPPPGSVLLSDFPDYVRGAFEAAFDRGGIRPSAAQWVGVLQRLEAQLRRCVRNAVHYHPSEASECPWCRMERTIGLVPFLPLATPMATAGGASPLGAFDLRSVWAAIEAVALPPITAPDPMLPPMDITPSQEAIDAAKALIGRRALGAMVCAGSLAALIGAPNWAVIWLGAGVFGLFKAAGATKSGDVFKARMKQAEQQRRNVYASWEQRCGGKEVLDLKASLQDAKAQLERLPAELRQRLATYDSKRRDFQLKAHLENYRVSAADIRGVGSGLKQALRSWGIESAYDVTFHAVLRVDGIGPNKARALEAWRRMVEGRFRFDPRPNATDARERERINREVTNAGDQLKTKLMRGAHDLRMASQTTLVKWRTVDQAVVRAAMASLQAEADSEHVNASLPQQLGRMSSRTWAGIIIVPILVLAFLMRLPVTIDNGPPPAATPVQQVQANAIKRFDAVRRYIVLPRKGGAPVKVRLSASGDAPTPGSLRTGSVVSAFGRAVGSGGEGWIAFTRPDGRTGFVAEKLLKLAPPQANGETCGNGSWFDRQLCHVQRVQELDRQLNKAYRPLLAGLSGGARAELVRSEKAWIAKRAMCQSSPDPGACISAAYSQRMAELNTWPASRTSADGRPLAPPQQAGSVVSVAPPSAPYTFPPVPRGNQADLISSDDYPPNALREQEQGSVTVRLNVGSDGRVEGCVVVASSGYGDLDDATCTLLTRRSRYAPAHDASNRPVPGIVTKSVTWRMPD